MKNTKAVDEIVFRFPKLTSLNVFNAYITTEIKDLHTLTCQLDTARGYIDTCVLCSRLREALCSSSDTTSNF